MWLNVSFSVTCIIFTQDKLWLDGRTNDERIDIIVLIHTVVQLWCSREQRSNNNNNFYYYYLCMCVWVCGVPVSDLQVLYHACLLKLLCGSFSSRTLMFGKMMCWSSFMNEWHQFGCWTWSELEIEQKNVSY